ncbi:7-carboxy-7-deazaguanine synthase QueE [Marinigracilibium pacificum]|nr:7-carboxy-7-deazaguanine synthase QueE [Marinigracilibium pacificum]
MQNQIKLSQAEIKSVTLPVMESFYTIQGEGAYQGHAAYFIRLGGCDVGCHWCDVKESWDASVHPQKSIKSLIDEISDIEGNIVVITGGEPLMHDLDVLTHAIKDNGKRTHIETSGTHKLTGNWDWVTFSPKKFKKPTDEIYDAADELKIVVYNKSDLEWAEMHSKRVKSSCKLYLQPEWSKADEMIPLIIDYVKMNPNWNISLQVHKFMQIP